jgi:hypothetical protein
LLLKRFLSAKDAKNAKEASANPVLFFAPFASFADENGRIGESTVASHVARRTARVGLS